MLKFKTYEDPINFYNLHMTTDFSRKLDRKFHLCENTEASLITNLQVLDQKRKLISETLKEFKEEYVYLLHNHMSNIEAIGSSILDKTKDELHGMAKSTKSKKSTEGDIFKE